MRSLLIARNEFEVADVMCHLSTETKVDRLKKWYDDDDVLSILGYYDDSMDEAEVKKLDAVGNDVAEFKKILYEMAIINGNFECAIAMDKRLPI